MTGVRNLERKARDQHR